MQITKFSHPHLDAGDWYLDCSCGFVPEFQEPLYSNLVSSGPVVIELEEEPEEDEIPPPPTIVKEVGSTKDKGRKLVSHASSQVFTRSYTKAFVERTVATSSAPVVATLTSSP